MAQEELCPSCGHANPVGTVACTNCNFPMHEAEARTAPPAPSVSAPAAAAPASSAPPEKEPEVVIDRRLIRPVRTRRPTGPEQQLQTQLWLVLGGLAVLFILYTAFDGFKKNAKPQVVAGAKEDQQHAADLARGVLAKDSTNLQARIALADVLYDTANWEEAIVNYRSAIRLDPKRVTSYVDMGVCYYNMSATDSAVALFQRALVLDPNQPVALFNLGVVAESADKYDEALKYYHRAMQSNPPEQMGQALMEAIQRIMKKQGKSAPPIPGAGGAAGMPQGK